MDTNTIRGLDGPALVKLAWEMGLAPEGTDWAQTHGLYRPALFLGNAEWHPYENLAQADAVFRSLRTRGYTTSCCWFGDDRQYGDAWVGCDGARAYAVQWPRDVATEAHALLLCAVLAVASEQERPPHPDGSVCSCRPSTAGWFRHHGGMPPGLAWPEGFTEALDTFQAPGEG